MINSFAAWLKSCLSRSRRGVSRLESPCVRGRGRARSNGTELSLQILEDRTVFAAGDLDPMFGQNGVVTLSGYNWTDQAFDAGGKVVSVGTFAGAASRDFVVARFNLDGTLDAGFGDAGVVTLDLANGSTDSAAGVAIDAEGRIVVGGTIGEGTGQDFVVVRFLADGSLDASFGVAGVSVIDVAGDRDDLRSISLYADGKLALVGTSSSGGSSGSSDMAAVRLNADGSLDGTFNGDGIAIIDFGGTDQANASAIDAQGRLVLVGGSNVTFTALARLDAAGNLDVTFSSDGKATYGTTADDHPREAFAVAIDAQGRILTTSRMGFAEMVRFNVDGTQDKTFGTNGFGLLYRLNGYTIREIVPDSRGGFIVAGDGYSHETEAYVIGVGRISSSGVTDYLFSDAAYGGFNPTDGVEAVTALRSLADGRLLVAGISRSNTTLSSLPSNPTFGTSRLVTLRLLSTGRRDLSFDGDGMAAERLNSSNLIVTASALQPDGKLLVVGTIEQDFVVRRYNVDGSVDASFGLNGSRKLDVMGNHANSAAAVAIDAEGKVLVAGSTGGAVGLVRLNADGSTDYDFGVNGVVRRSAGVDAKTTNVLLDGDGRIILVGTSKVSNTARSSVFALRLTHLGQIDSSFGTLGVARYSFGNGCLATDAELDSAGRLVVVGAATAEERADADMLLLRFTDQGVLDATFAAAGVLRLDVSNRSSDWAGALAIDAAGRIVVAGSTGLVGGSMRRAVVLRTNAHGAVDATFGVSGVASLELGSSQDALYAVRFDSQGRLLIAGQADGDLFAARLTENGAIDPEFGDAGLYKRAYAGEGDLGLDVSFDGEGRLIVTGTGPDGGVVVRLQSEPGSLSLSGGQLRVGEPAGAAVGVVHVAGTGVADFGYSLVDDANGLFILDGNVVRTTGALTTAELGEHVLRVRAEGPGGVVVEREFTVVVAPALTVLAPTEANDVDSVTNAVNLGVSGGTYVGVTAQAVPADQLPVAYSLSNDAGGRFMVEASTGVVRVRDGVVLDAAPSGSFTITVRADSGGGYSEADFVVYVVDPGSWAVIDVNPTANFVREGATTVYTGIGVNATSPLGEAAYFGNIQLIDSAGGTFSLAGAMLLLNKPIPFGGPTSYSVTFKATVGLLSTTTTFVIDVLPNAPPTTPYDSSSSANAVIEGASINSPTGVKVTSTDPGEPPVTYLLIDDAGGIFKIDGSGQVLTTGVPRTGTAGSTSYTITAVAIDAYGLQSEAVDFTIDLVNAPPSAPIDADPAINQFYENAAGGTPIGLTASSTDVGGTPIVYSLTGFHTNLFQIDATTGVVSVRDGADFGNRSSNNFTITVVASDGQATVSKNFALTVINLPPDAPTDVDATVNSVYEGTFDVYTGITLASPTSSYYELTDDAGGRLVLQGNKVYLAAGASLDYETASSYTFQARALDRFGLWSSPQTFTVDVKNRGPFDLRDVNGAANLVPFDVVGGTIVGITLQATEPAGGAVSYSLLNDAGGRFVIDSATGVVSVAPGGAPFLGGQYTIAAQASDGEATTMNWFTIVAEYAPLIDANSSPNVLKEGLQSNVKAGVTVRPSVSFGGTPRYSIVNPNPGSSPRFVIDPKTGVISTGKNVEIDYESVGGKYTITVQVEDNGRLSQGDFSIDVTNVAPSAPFDVDMTRNQVTEKPLSDEGIAVQMGAGDPSGGSNLRYKLTNDAAGRFTIDEVSGRVAVRANADIDAAIHKSFTITVVATDGEFFSPPTNVKIEVARRPPSFLGDNDPAENEVYEGAAPGSLVGITAVPGDATGPSVTYSITQNYNNWFTIDSATGVVRVAPKASIGLGEYMEFEIWVKATDGVVSSESSYYMIILDAPPTAPLDVNSAANTITEGAKAGTKVGITASAADPGGGKVTYSLTSNPGNKFAIDSKGVITVAKGAVINHQEVASYTLTVQATDGELISTADFVVNVANLAPAAPTDVNSAVNFVAENAAAGTLVGLTVSAKDAPGGAPIYTLVNDAGGRFVIDSATGVVRVAEGAVIDFESDGGYYVVTVQADDGASASASDFVIQIGHPTATAFLAADPSNPELTSLFVYGTDGKDSIKFALTTDGTYAVTIGKTRLAETFAPTGRIFVYGAAGDDVIDVGATTTLPAYLDGGLGKDSLSGGLGDDVILGRDGDDSLSGRGGRDVLIGGFGKDKLVGEGTGSTIENEGNILIGDATSSDADRDALSAISAAWTENNPGRVIESVVAYFNEAEIDEDGAVDTLTGGGKGLDWFFSFELTSKGKRLDKLSALAATDWLNDPLG